MSDHLITTRAIATTCPQCSAIVIAGHAEGLPVRCDTTALNLHGELQARIEGRSTYNLTRTGDRLELVYRDQHRITRRNHDVLAEHTCSTAGLISTIVDPTAWRPAARKPTPEPAQAAQLQFIPTDNTPPPF